MTRSTPPSTGERAAAAGYALQYRIAAQLTLMYLRDLEWVAVADPCAGGVDDFALVTRHAVHALQVRWAQHPPGRARCSRCVAATTRYSAVGWRLAAGGSCAAPTPIGTSTSI